VKDHQKDDDDIYSPKTPHLCTFR